MANVIGNIFRVKDLRKKVLFTLFILIVYRIGAHVPIPGVNVEQLEKFFEAASKGSAGGLLNFFDLFAGGALKRFTVFALGIMPYISASIIIQLLAVVIPSLGTLTKEGGPEGRKKINSYTKYLTIFLCIFQSTGISMMLVNNGVVTEGYGYMFYAINAIAITTGTLVLMWLGEIITERGIGNGVSLIIFAGIVVRFPAAMIDTGSRIVNRSEPIMAVVLGMVFLIVIAASILLTLGRRNIPIQYGKRQMGDRQVSTGGQTLPLPLNAGNVIPIIFAVALMQLPAQISNMFSIQDSSWLSRVQFYLSPGHPVYIAVYCLLIIFFCFFYSTIVFNPDDVSENLKKYQGFIPGIRPGTATAEYLLDVLYKITLSGAIFLCGIAIFPDIIMKMWPEEVSPEMAYMFGGTSLMIIVGVALDTLKQLESQLMMRHYDGFFKNGKMKGRR